MIPLGFVKPLVGRRETLAASLVGWGREALAFTWVGRPMASFSWANCARRIVGELDRNVDPASTPRVVNGLVKADKDYDPSVMTGAGHDAAETP